MSWPLRDEPPTKTILLLALIGITVGLSYLIMNYSGAILAAILLFVLLGPYFLPTRYKVSERGVESRFPLFNRSRSWGEYKRYAVARDGVFLGTFPRPSRLDSFRGEFLRFTAGMDPEQVLELVRRHIPAPQDDKQCAGKS
ncbi:MAG: hypothetical protein ACUVWX_05850 [Kiritimatiellia bacterium]